jgi:hypothetical protein
MFLSGWADACPLATGEAASRVPSADQRAIGASLPDADGAAQFKTAQSDRSKQIVRSRLRSWVRLIVAGRLEKRPRRLHI